MAYFFSIKVKMFSTLGPYIFPTSYLQLVNWICGGREGGGTVGGRSLLELLKTLNLILLLSFSPFMSLSSPSNLAGTFPAFPVK